MGSFAPTPPSNAVSTIYIDLYIDFFLLSDNNSDWKTFLEKNYTQFKEKNTTVYLATVNERSLLQSRSVNSHLILDVGNGLTWAGYSNGPLDAGGIYQ